MRLNPNFWIKALAFLIAASFNSTLPYMEDSCNEKNESRARLHSLKS